jgi:4-aminobutyrate aminotransferase-like enzyme
MACRARSPGKGVVSAAEWPPKDTALQELAAEALELLTVTGREQLTERWHEVAGTGRAHRAVSAAAITGDTSALTPMLRRRRETLGAHAELSYERPLHLVRAEGVWVYTASGERLLDVYNNVPHVGHAHPSVVAAIARQARRIASNTRYLDERILDYGERLLATLPAELDTCLLVNSGSEANDIAWRLARLHTGQSGALVMAHAYHGITEAITALSPATTRGKSPAHVQQLAAPLATGTAAATADVLNAIQRLAGRGFGVAALLIDSALTSTGIFDPPLGWSQAIAAAVHAAGGLIIADEVQYGLGRSGSHFWGFARRGFEPDIVTLGKPVANGYPVGVVVTRRALLERFQQETGFFSTFGGNPVACAAALAVLDVLQSEQLLENAHATGSYFVDQLKAVVATQAALVEVRGCGLMIGVEVAGLPERSGAATRQIVNGLRERGVLIGAEGPHANVLKLRPPMPFRRQHVDAVLEALTEVLRRLGPH